MMKRHTVKELQSMIADHSASSQEIYKLYNNRIRTMNDSINAFISIESNEYSSDDKQADSEISGVPYAVKDIFCSEGDQTTLWFKNVIGFCFSI
jgi:Asp-tRNAAsn/Glu-tRNAGln amidotransferase A subunit and related amidases